MNLRQITSIIFVFIAVTSVSWWTKTTLEELNYQGTPSPALVQKMVLISSAFTDGGEIPVQFTCHGGNKNPPLSISGVPSATKFLALELNDPDAPLGLFVHWVIWNIAPNTQKIASGSIPDKSQEGTNGAGKLGYTGPCPPAKHRYFFKLFALDTQIGLDGKAKEVDLEKAMSGHIIAQSTLTGIFGGK